MLKLWLEAVVLQGNSAGCNSFQATSVPAGSWGTFQEYAFYSPHPSLEGTSLLIVKTDIVKYEHIPCSKLKLDSKSEFSFMSCSARGCPVPRKARTVTIISDHQSTMLLAVRCNSLHYLHYYDPPLITPSSWQMRKQVIFWANLIFLSTLALRRSLLSSLSGTSQAKGIWSDATFIYPICRGAVYSNEQCLYTCTLRSSLLLQFAQHLKPISCFQHLASPKYRVMFCLFCRLQGKLPLVWPHNVKKTSLKTTTRKTAVPSHGVISPTKLTVQETELLERLSQVG